MRVLWSASGWRGGVEPVMGLAVRLRVLGTPVRVYAPPDRVATEGRDARVTIGVAPAGVWR